jgi:hypothetical protein
MVLFEAFLVFTVAAVIGGLLYKHLTFRKGAKK